MPGLQVFTEDEGVQYIQRLHYIQHLRFLLHKIAILWSPKKVTFSSFSHPCESLEADKERKRKEKGKARRRGKGKKGRRETEKVCTIS